MNTFLKRIMAFCMVATMLLGVLPVQAGQNITDRESVTVEDMTNEADTFWEKIETREKALKETKGIVSDYMKAAFNMVASYDNVTEISWDDEDTFGFRLSSGISCVYDYEIRMSTLDFEGEPTGEITVNDYGTKAETATHNKDVVVFGPYYGVDSSFTDYYVNLANDIAEKKGGTATIFSGTQATPAAVRSYVANRQNNAVVIFDTHGISSYGTSYVGVYGSEGLTTEILNNLNAVSLSDGYYGIDGYYMTYYGTLPVSDCLIWFASCESMMTDGLGYPLIYSGASVVYGYSQEISFTQDYNYAGTFWEQMINKKTVAEAAAAMKSAHGTSDPYGGLHAYPIFMSETDAYPQNPDALQDVTSDWKLFTDTPEYVVTFYDWDGTGIAYCRVWQGENSLVPADPVREGYTFTGWDKDLTNVQSDIDTYATYKINEYNVVFNDWDGTELSSVTVEHGGAATAPNDPIREDHVFVGWDKDFSYVTSDLTVTAQYSKTNCTVTFKDWDGTVLSTATVEYAGTVTAPEDPSREGYDFAGWDRELTNITDDTVITAQYNIKTYQVVFKDYDGTTLSTQTVDHGGSATPPTAPKREGYTFTGWDGNYTNVTSYTEVSAVYTINVYTVTFCDWDGRIIKNEDVEHGGSATPPADPERGGYTFTGWDGTYTNVIRSSVVVAQYEEYLVPQYAVSNVNGRKSTDIVVNISIHNNPGLTKAGIDFTYDETILELVSVENGTVMAGDDVTFTVDGNSVTWASTNVYSGNGVMLVLNLRIKDTAETGDTAQITIAATENAGADAEAVEFETIDGNVTVNNFMLGDVNNDGLVNTGDVLFILRYLADDDITIDLTAADINGNGSITTADATYLLRHIAGHDIEYFNS